MLVGSKCVRAQVCVSCCCHHHRHHQQQRRRRRELYYSHSFHDLYCLINFNFPSNFYIFFWMEIFSQFVCWKVCKIRRTQKMCRVLCMLDVCGRQSEKWHRNLIATHDVCDLSKHDNTEQSPHAREAATCERITFSHVMSMRYARWVCVCV